ncbi:MAG: TM1802 family CRISPR-associated protein [Nitrososphaerota archaeon]
MIESILLIGKLLEGKDIPKASRRGGKKETYIVRIIFDVDTGTVYADPIRYSEQLEREYRWVGHVQRAARDPVERLTVKNVEYITGSKGKYSSITNIRKRIARLRERNMVTSNEIVELDKYLELIESTFFKQDSERVQTAVNQALMDAAINTKMVELYTVCLKYKGKLIELAKTGGYEEFLKVTQENPETKLEPAEGLCYLCNSRTEVLTDPAFDVASLLKIYVVDKKGFSSGISEDSGAWARTFAICRSCRTRLQNGWKFVKENLKTNNVKGTVTYLIPRLSIFSPDAAPSPELLIGWAQTIRDAYNAVSTYDGLMQFEKQMKDYSQIATEDGLAWYSLTVVFSKTGTGAHFSLEGVIHDVPITRLSELGGKMLELEKWAQSLLKGDQRNFDVGLSAIAEVFPLEADRRHVPRILRPLLELYDSLLTGSLYPHHQLVRRALLMARIHRYDSYEGFSISPPKNRRSAGERDIALCRDTLKYNLLAILLREMGALQPETHQDNFDPLCGDMEVRLPEDVREWFSKVRYTGHQKALFLLGYLVAEIGRAQYLKGDTKKSVLDKIDFNGMRREKVIELANGVYKSLRDYRLLSGKNEVLYGIAINLLNMNMENLSNPVDNTYYVLSGYAFRTYQIVTSSGQESDVEGEEENE